MKLIIDTSVLIDNLRGGKFWNSVIDEIEKKDLEIILPTIVIFELFSGKSSRELTIIRKIDRLTGHFERLELNESIAKRAGELLRDLNYHIDASDYIIAASALEIGATVLTLNRKHFEQIPNLSLYPI